ncbi:hypothetical protein L345_12174, partial [Ophiophagus hannah]
MGNSLVAGPAVNTVEGQKDHSYLDRETSLLLRNIAGKPSHLLTKINEANHRSDQIKTLWLKASKKNKTSKVLWPTVLEAADDEVED